MVNYMVDRATSGMLVGPDWAMNVEICEILNQDYSQAKDVIRGIKKRIGSKNAKVQLLSLTLLETVIKNCGDIIRLLVAEQDILHEMIKITKKKPDIRVKEKILVLIDTWQEAFGGPRAKFPQYYAAYQELLRAGAVFPRRPESSAPGFILPQTQSMTPYVPNQNGLGPQEQEACGTSAESEFPVLSLAEIQNARGIMDVLSEMLNALNPENKEELKQEVIVDLVEQCRNYKQRVVHLINSSMDESLLCQGLSLNDDLQNLLARHESITSGNPLPLDDSKAESKKSKQDVGCLVDTGDDSVTAGSQFSKSLPLVPVDTPPVTSGSALKQDPHMDLLSSDDYNSSTSSQLALVPAWEPQPNDEPLQNDAGLQKALVPYDMLTESGTCTQTSDPQNSGMVGVPNTPPPQHNQWASGQHSMPTCHGDGGTTTEPQQMFYQNTGMEPPPYSFGGTPMGQNVNTVRLPHPQLIQQNQWVGGQSPLPMYSIDGGNTAPQQHVFYQNPNVPQYAWQQSAFQSVQSTCESSGSFPPPPWESQISENEQRVSGNSFPGSEGINLQQRPVVEPYGYGYVNSDQVMERRMREMHLAPNRPLMMKKAEDKLFGDLVDMSKFKPASGKPPPHKNTSTTL